jgi:hypothetical protein
MVSPSSGAAAVLLAYEGRDLLSTAASTERDIVVDRHGVPIAPDQAMTPGNEPHHTDPL